MNMTRNGSVNVMLLGMFVAVAALSIQLSHASAEAITQLRHAMANKNLTEFSRILDSGAIGLEEFSSERHLYELVCASTSEGYADYFDRLLDYGVDPSAEDPSPNRHTFSLLVCAHRHGNRQAFERLLDAGARSEILLCENCLPAGQEPLVVRALDVPEMFLAIARRRELTNAELVHVGNRISTRYHHSVWNDQMLNEFYADYLQRRGVYVSPKRRSE